MEKKQSRMAEGNRSSEKKTMSTVICLRKKNFLSQTVHVSIVWTLRRHGKSEFKEGRNLANCDSFDEIKSDPE